MHKKKVEWVTGLSLKFSVGCKRLKFLDLIKTLIAITTVWHVEKKCWLCFGILGKLQGDQYGLMWPYYCIRPKRKAGNY